MCMCVPVVCMSSVCMCVACVCVCAVCICVWVSTCAACVSAVHTRAVEGVCAPPAGLRHRRDPGGQAEPVAAGQADPSVPLNRSRQASGRPASGSQPGPRVPSAALSLRGWVPQEPLQPPPSRFFLLREATFQQDVPWLESALAAELQEPRPAPRSARRRALHRRQQATSRRRVATASFLPRI